MKILYTSIIVAITLWGCNSTTENALTQEKPEPNFTIAIGSCARHNLPEHLWAEVVNSQHDLWIWLVNKV